MDIWEKLIKAVIIIGGVIAVVFLFRKILLEKEEGARLENICQESCGTYGLHTTTFKNNKMYCICGGPEGPIVNEIDLK